MSAASATTRPPWGLAWRLALGQIVSWGVLYYAFTVIAGPMQHETGWSRPFVNAGLSLGLLSWGLCAFPAGVWIQRRGARGLMAAASVLGAGALVMIGGTTTPGIHLGAWVLLGASMAGVLYEPAFAVVVEHSGSSYRRGIMLVTLVGGLASTVFIPLAQVLVNRLGWRDALILLAVLQVAVCVPIHAWGIPRRVSTSVASSRERAGLPGFFTDLGASFVKLRQELRDPRFVGLAVWFYAQAAASSGLTFLLIPILQEAQVPSGAMLQAIALIGPMQVLGRLALAARGDRFESLQAGLWTTMLLGIALFLMIAMSPTRLVLIAFVALYGISNGVMTILRGTAVAELFGRERYAELNGALSLPAVATRAGSPLALAAVWNVTGSAQSVYAVTLAVVVLGAAGLIVAATAQPLDRGDRDVRSYRQNQRVARDVSLYRSRYSSTSSSLEK